jgi:cytochrome c oxidase subunit 2
LFTFLFWWAASADISSLSAPANALEVHVVAKQWMWKTQQPNGAREINALHVPVDKPVRLVMTSQDVIHSFSVPSFGIKIDAIPGRLNKSWFKAEQEGMFYGQCSNICGIDHAFMPINIRVLSQPDYEAWLAQAKKQFAVSDQVDVAAAPRVQP